MIKVYANLVIHGIKTIEDVPPTLRERVLEYIKQLEGNT